VMKRFLNVATAQNTTAGATIWTVRLQQTSLREVRGNQIFG